MLIIGGLLLALVVVVGIITYFAVMVMFWLLVASFAVWVVIGNVVFHDPAVAFLAAIPATLLTWWIVGRKA